MSAVFFLPYSRCRFSKLPSAAAVGVDGQIQSKMDFQYILVITREERCIKYVLMSENSRKKCLVGHSVLEKS